jgi:hypothetical protein
VVCGPRLLIRAAATKGIGIGMHRLGEPRGECGHGLTERRSPGDDLVVDIRDVADIVNRVAPLAQVADHHVEHHHSPRVAEVAVVVDRHPAYVQTDLRGVDRHEWGLPPRQAVMDLKHPDRLPWRPAPPLAVNVADGSSPASGQ